MAGNPDEKFLDIEQLLADLSKADPLAENLGKRATGSARKLGLDARSATQTGGAAAVLIQTVLALVSLLISIVVKLGAPLVVIFLKVLTKFRTEAVQEQLDISAAVVSEFLAAEIKPEHIKTGKGVDETIAAANSIGGSVIDRLTKEFGGTGNVTPESGEKAAKTFVGYAVNFGVQNAMLGTLADAISVHFLENFRDLGQEVARNMGLGRLVRLALTPLVRNLVQEPYDQLLRKRYRPDLLSEQHAVDAFFGQLLDDAGLTDILQRKGYSDAYIPVVISQLRKKLSPDELDTLLRSGDIGQEFAKAELRAAGYDDVKGAQKLKIQRLQRLDSVVGTMRSLVTKQRVDGLIDDALYNSVLDNLGLSEEEKKFERDLVTASLAVPRAFLPWSEVKKAFEGGFVDLDYVDRWLSREGYSEEDQLVRELLLFDELGQKQEKAAAKAAKEARKTQPPTP